MRRGSSALVTAGTAFVLCLSLVATAVSEPRITVRDSTHKYKYKPSTLYFASPALTPPFKLTKLQRWVSWSVRQSEATATKGWLHYDNCKPNCAEGHYRRKRAMVQLYAPHRCHGRLVFGKVWVKPRHLPAHAHKINCRGFLK
jgi:hypothetical protein